MDEDDDVNNIGEHLENVAYEVAMGYIAKCYLDLRKAGLSREDSAAIVAAIISRSEVNGED